MNAPVNPILQPDFDSSVPAVLLPYQQAWIADTSQLKVAEKSRRIGLTWAEAADAVLDAMTEGGQNCYYLGYNKDMTVEFIQACAMWAKAYDAAASEIEESIWEDGDKHIQTYIIRFPNSGKRIEALTSRPSNLRGRQGRVILDEAGFHENLDELLKAALALLIWGGCVRVISTHDGEDNPFNELIKEIRAGKRKGTVHRTTFREAVDQGLYKRVCLRKGIEYKAEEEQAWVDDVYSFYGDAADEELDVIPSKGGGRWLSQSLLEQRQKEIPVIRWAAPKNFETWSTEARHTEIELLFNDVIKPLIDSLPKKARSYYGLDFARRADLCVFWPLIEYQDTRKHCPFVLEISNMPYKQQEQLFKLIVKALPNFSKGANDATGNGGFLAEAMQEVFGDKVEAIHLSESWYREHTPHFKSALEDADIASIPKDKDIMDDHRAFVLVKGVARIPDVRTTGQDGKKRHGDSAIAHLLADYASKNPSAPIEFTPIPSRDDRAWDEDNLVGERSFI
ncbi:hypothetical protein WCE14_00695 [Acinetobacter schindleri]|uniref:hypothetical protein n=1 Tax=Acinetobacter schindleri TaxID=108981 RepID=UPI0034D70CEB